MTVTFRGDIAGITHRILPVLSQLEHVMKFGCFVVSENERKRCETAAFT